MEAQPSLSGRFNLEAATTSTSSSSPSRENSIARTSSSKSIFEHNLSSILNNPHSSRSSDASSWLGWWSSSNSVILPEFSPINTSKPELDTNKSDFQPYIASISEHYARFEDICNHSSKESVDVVESIGGQGEALVACLREVPALYFKEDFQLEDGATFRAACPFSTMNENLVLQERLSQYLDVVEMHLVKEISLRSNSFFEAQQQLGDLNVKIVEGCKRIRELKEMIKLLDVDVVGSARQIQEFSSMRNNLLELQQKLRLILSVNQALGALKLLVSSADCAGALDVADDLRQLLDGDELTGLHCFRHLRDHVAASMETVNSILSEEFMRASLHDAGDLDVVIISQAKERASDPSNGRLGDVKLDEEETSVFRDCLLPIIIGLLRTAKLPSVLRMYRDTLTADMKTAIKTAVAELLPILVARGLEKDFTAEEKTGDADGGGGSLASRLRSLSSESFVQLLAAVFNIVLAHLVRAAEVKKSIEWIMSNLDGHYAAESVAAAIAHGAAASEAAQDDHNQNQVNSYAVAYSSQRNTIKNPHVQGKANELTSPSNVSKNFRADVLRENAEAVFAACDAAHGRWAKLLGVRALLHPKLRLSEFLSIYSITQEFINATEKIGGRLGYSIRGTLQSQAKAFVDFQHESRMSKIQAVLDQETWSEVDVPEEFQAIVTSMLSSGSQITEISGDDEDSEMRPNNGVSTLVNNIKESNAEQQMEQTDSNNVSGDASSKKKSQHVANATTSSGDGKNSNMKDRGKSTPHTLIYKGVGYHMVNCGLILLKMLSEYIDMNYSLPTLSSEIIHRVVGILKCFNTRTCQLVLGAGAMQVSGLKSITSKHLALASQVISFTYAIIPDLKQILFLNVPETRKLLLQSEIDRVAQDYKVHRDEIHSKLVQIMRERLLYHLQKSWNKPEEDETQPSLFAKSVTKEVGILQRVLSRTLHEADVQAIFRQVVIIFHSLISDAYSRMEINTPQAKTRVSRDIQHILGCIRTLPTDIASKSGVANWGHLDELLAQKFGSEGDQ
ncbi:vacuolar protein sorting-associated protein 54, chloroplastic isoform X2 [Amaranthus tricolor]|uniref:vacuolar protein sorting-associated protein 54, chloroplastic isoform X2 n=1 Tax=Amaranthus tricolor TaxID=29722 RepID=UPI002584F5A1|nr:vacuolar protein sorting-associated protein 54, chloroplastic isoform X2 [Amaranthus tricolor]XP_057546412.1 vacuolar protein sorting-associated protein 54, chloroplastic isoform X2 [Amaranthus tricolor]